MLTVGRSGRTQLEHRTKIDRAYWELGLFRGAAEAVGSFHSAGQSASRGVRGLEVTDSAERAARRALGRMRRYCAGNRLNRLGDGTYDGLGQWDERLLRKEVGAFFRLLRQRVGRPFPYVWVPEWHALGHGLHFHFAVGRFIPRGWIVDSWPHGFVDIKYLGDLPVGSGSLGEARTNARYLAKYIGKDMGDSGGLHRYDVARGFQPERLALTGTSADDVLGQATAVMGREPARVWRSSDMERWEGPAAVWAQWNG
jgi:hypothetical protein